MNDSGQASQSAAEAERPPADLTKGHCDSDSPQPQEVSQNHIQKTKKPFFKYVREPFKAVVAWVDGHNGFVTALSTVAIAVLTFFLAVYANGQLRVFSEQLAEMKSSGGQTDTLIETNKKLAEAAVKSAEVAEKTLKITQRAYFYISASVKDFEKGHIPKGVISIKNVGITPAYKVVLKTAVGLATYPFPDDYALSMPDIPIAASVVAKDESLSEGPPLAWAPTDDQFDAVNLSKNYRIIVWATVDFNDAFGCPIERNVCFLFDGEAARTNLPQLCSGNRNTEKYVGDCQTK